jgi:hypothetical protein
VRTKPENVVNALDEAISERLRTGEWRVYPHYERREVGNGDVYIYAPLSQIDESDPDMLKIYDGMRNSLESDESYDTSAASEMAARHAGILRQNEPRLYRPLVDKPDLLLRFAELAEKGPITDKVVLDWVRSYGVLGLDKSLGAASMGNPRGGPYESVFAFGERAAEVNLMLKLYEAATSQYGPDEETIKKHMIMPEVPHQQSWLARPKTREWNTEEGDRQPDRLEQSPLAKPSVLNVVRNSLQEIAVKRHSRSVLGERALYVVREIVSTRFAEECSQGQYLQKDGTYRQGWRFKSLLGAIYFQMSSLMAYTGKMRVCRAPGCFESFSLESPEPYLDESSGKYVTPRKPRSDKRVCDNHACKKAYERLNK